MSRYTDPEYPPIVSPCGWFLIGSCFWFPLIVFSMMVMYSISFLDAEYALVILKGIGYNLIVGMVCIASMRFAVRSFRQDDSMEFLWIIFIGVVYWIGVFVLTNIWLREINALNVS